MKLDPFPRPLPFITVDSDLKLHLNQDTASRLRAITTQVYVVAVVGKYRTGKSFLLNKLAGKDITARDGFNLGSTVQSTTKGIWAWPVACPGSNCTLILLDTEGLGDIDKGDSNHDAWIFILTALMANTLIYNVTGILSQDGSDQLHFICNLVEYMSTKRNTNPDEVGCDFPEYLPNLIVCLRDFCLTLEVDGSPVTPDEYLEHCLMQRKPNMSKRNQDFNELRDKLAFFFEERKCFVFPQPVAAKRLNLLDNLKDTDLNPDFTHAMKELQDYVCRSLPNTKSGEVILDGKGLVFLANEYTKAQRENVFLCIESSLSYVTRMTNQDAVEKAVDHYKREMLTLKLPVAENVLRNKHSEAAERAQELFEMQSMQVESCSYKQKLQECLHKELVSIQEKNNNESRKICKEKLFLNYKSITNFMHPEGITHFDNMVRQILDDYKKGTNLGPKAEEELKHFERQVDTDRKDINKVINDLSKKEKEIISCRQQLDRRMEEKNQQELEEQEKQHGYGKNTERRDHTGDRRGEQQADQRLTTDRRRVRSMVQHTAESSDRNGSVLLIAGNDHNNIYQENPMEVKESNRSRGNWFERFQEGWHNFIQNLSRRFTRGSQCIRSDAY